METNAYYASLGSRLVAFFLDCLVLAIPCAIASHVIPFVGGLVILFFYAPVLECSQMRATLGKYWMGIQVTDLQGRRISFQSALIRNLVKLFSTGILFLGCLVAFFTSKKQTLHDLLADTVVVYGRDEQPIATAWENSVRGIFGGEVFQRPSDTISKLERLQRLREKGTITEEEFQAEKRKIMAEEAK